MVKVTAVSQNRHSWSHGDASESEPSAFVKFDASQAAAEDFEMLTVSMGFSPQAARNALRESNGHIDRAVDILVASAVERQPPEGPTQGAAEYV